MIKLHSLIKTTDTLVLRNKNKNIQQLNHSKALQPKQQYKLKHC